MMVEVRDLHCRAGDRYHFVSVDELDDELGWAGGRHSEHVGLLRERTGAGTGRWVDRSVALLWLLLERSPGAVPGFVFEDLGSADAERHILGLVADHILEVELDGDWFSGVEALGRLGRAAVRPEGPVGALSLRALELAASLPRQSPAESGRSSLFFQSSAAIGAVSRTLC